MDEEVKEWEVVDEEVEEWKVVELEEALGEE